MRRLLKLPALIALLALGACQTKQTGSVSISTVGLREAALESDQALVRIAVKVRDAVSRRVVFDEEFEPSINEFEVQVDAGLVLGFEVIAFTNDAAAFWGGVDSITVPARDVVNLVIPVFPAGSVGGNVTALDGTTVPDGTPVAMRAVNPRTGVRSVFGGFTESGAYLAHLPTGDYTVGVAFQTPNGEIGLVNTDQMVTVEQGVLAALDLAVAGASFCTPDSGGAFPDADGDGDACNVDCNDADPSINLADVDGDGLSGCAGDLCPLDPDNDVDGDTVCGDVDNCPTVGNRLQVDMNNNGIGDACEGTGPVVGTDTDQDGIEDGMDNCPMVPNPTQSDADADLTGDVCDDCTDADADGLGIDSIVLTAMNGSSVTVTLSTNGCTVGAPDVDDSDASRCADTDFDQCDDCASGTFTPGADGPDLDGDGMCDLGDPDDDNDGVIDSADPFPFGFAFCGDSDQDGCDDCSIINDGFGPAAEADPANDGPDLDGDGLCDASDSDQDGDTVPDESDNCPRVANVTQADADNDNHGDACDCNPNASSCTTDCTTDLDNDMVMDCMDRCLDQDNDTFGSDLSFQVVGEGFVVVQDCETSTMSPCSLTPTCMAQDNDEDLDGDGQFDFNDNCLDVDQDGAGFDGGRIWSSNAAIELFPSGPPSRFDPQIAASENTATMQTTWMAIWVDGNTPLEEEIKFATSNDDGNTWSSAADVISGTRPGAQTEPVLHSAPDGKFFIVFTDQFSAGDSEIRFVGTQDYGATWSSVTRVDDSAPTGNAFDPDLTFEPADSVLIATWVDERDGTKNIYSAISTDFGGGWSPDINVSMTTGDSAHPAIAANRDGGAYITWADDSDGDGEIFSAVVYSINALTSIGWAPQFKLTDDNDNQLYPDIAVDASGAAVVIWQDDAFVNSAISAAYSKHNGTGWDVIPVPIPGDTMFAYQKPVVTASATSGGFWVAATGDDTTQEDVFAANSQDGRFFSPFFPFADSLANQQSHPALALHNGVVAAVWEDDRANAGIVEIFSSHLFQGCHKGVDCDDSDPSVAFHCVDVDGDGFYGEDGADCDDYNATIFPGQTEICDFVDNNCAQDMDEGLQQVVAFEDMENGAPGWTTQVLSGATNGWALVSQPQFGPGAGGSVGTTLYGTPGNNGSANLTEDSALVSPVFDVAGLRGVGIGFQFYTFNESGCDTMRDRESWEYSFDGVNWMTLNPCGGGFDDEGEIDAAYQGTFNGTGGPVAIPPGATGLQTRFRFTTGPATGNVNDDGWYIDNVQIFTCQAVATMGSGTTGPPGN